MHRPSSYAKNYFITDFKTPTQNQCPRRSSIIMKIVTSVSQQEAEWKAAGCRVDNGQIKTLRALPQTANQAGQPLCSFFFLRDCHFVDKLKMCSTF